MGVLVEKLAFYDFKKQEKIPINLPSEENIEQLNKIIIKKAYFKSPIL